MIELESDAYTMNEEETKSLKVKRVGGTKGEIRAKLQPNPGTAIQDDYDTTLIPEIVLGEIRQKQQQMLKQDETQIKPGINISQLKLQMSVKEQSLDLTRKLKLPSKIWKAVKVHWLHL